MEGGHFLQVKKECLRALCMYARADLCTVDVSHSTRMHRVHGVREMKHLCKVWRGCVRTKSAYLNMTNRPLNPNLTCSIHKCLKSVDACM